jgi:hypothetical protein
MKALQKGGYIQHVQYGLGARLMRELLGSTSTEDDSNRMIFTGPNAFAG